MRIALIRRGEALADYDIIVIGGGISGLSFAHYCAKSGLRTAVVEKSGQPGGALHSHSFASGSKRFWLELGAHTCYNSYTNLIGILEDDSLINNLQSRDKAPFKILVDNEMRSIPSKLNMLAMMAAPVKMATLKKKGQDLRTYYSKLAGRTNYENVLRHAFEAVVSQPADDYPAELLFKKRQRRKEIIKKFTFPEGVQTVANTISAEKDIDLIASSEVSSIRINDDSVSVTAGGRTIEALNLAIATPASTASELLRDAMPELAAELSAIKVKKTESMGVIIESKATPVERFSNLIATEDIFYSAVSRDVIPDPDLRGFTFHFKPDIANYEEKIARIKEVLKVKASDLKEVIEKDNYLPALKVGHDSLVEKIDAMLSANNVFLTGNYFYGMAIEDCVTRSLDQFNKLSATL